MMKLRWLVVLALLGGSGVLGATTGCVGGEVEAEPCTVVAENDGGATVSCPDGTSVTLPRAPDGTSCAVEEEAGERRVRCDDGSSVVLESGASRECVVRAQPDGTATLRCEGSPDTVVALDEDCDAVEGDVLIDSDAALRAFAAAGCAEIRGHLIIGQLEAETLEGLETLERVGGRLAILGNPNLRSLAGLENLQSILEDREALWNSQAVGVQIRQNLSLPECEIQWFLDRLVTPVEPADLQLQNNGPEGDCD